MCQLLNAGTHQCMHGPSGGRCWGRPTGHHPLAHGLAAWAEKGHAGDCGGGDGAQASGGPLQTRVI